MDLLSLANSVHGLYHVCMFAPASVSGKEIDWWIFKSLLIQQQQQQLPVRSRFRGVWGKACWYGVLKFLGFVHSGVTIFELVIFTETR